MFLAHRMPYPPDKGDKIRSYHLMRGLAQRYTVHLGAFMDDPQDEIHVNAVRQYCGEILLRPLNKRLASLRSACALAAGNCLSTAYYRDKVMRRWVGQLAARRQLAGVFVFSSAMGQYAQGLPLPAGAVRVMDFCDVDSDKWRQYAESHHFPLRHVYAHEARELSAAEATYVREFDVSLVVSEVEAHILRKLARGFEGRILAIPNGVDTDFFDPSRFFENPFSTRERPIVFTGAMDYHANVDAVRWFAHEILPAVRARVPETLFAIVGSNPTAEVDALAELPGVMVTGRVPDVRPFLAHAAVVVAPLRIARGVQNKVLEALAMSRAVVATDNAIQGIPDARDAGVRVAQDPDSFVEAVVGRMHRPLPEALGRDFVKAHYAWPDQLRRVESLFERRLMPEIAAACGQVGAV